MKKQNILSLFDGISCGRLAIKRAEIPVNIYYASEIEKAAISVGKANFPDNHYLGDVRNVYVSSLKEIDLLIGGSPCQSFSFAGKRNGMSTKENIDILDLDTYLRLKDVGFEFIGQSYLFWEYVRILREIQEYNPDVKFLLENVVMAKKWENVISEALGVKPILINSSLVSAQNRKRLYWTNIKNVTQPEDKKIHLQNILEDDIYNKKAAIRGRRLINGKRSDYSDIPIVQYLEVTKNFPNKSNCLTTVEKDNVLTFLDYGRYENAFQNKDSWRKYTREEYEKLQTLDIGYTNVISESAAKKAIGNGWTIDVISHILLNYKREK